MRSWLITIASTLVALTSLVAEAEDTQGYASFVRTTIVGRLADLEPSIVFWRDVMGFEYRGDPEPRTGRGNEYLGWGEEATTYFTAFSSKEGSTVALLLVEDQSDFPEQKPFAPATAYGSVVLVHTAKGIRDIYDRAVANDVEIVKPYGLSGTGLSYQMMFRAPTGHMVEIYEVIQQD